MRISWARVGTVARREFLTTIRRKAFLFTVLATPAYFAFITAFMARVGLNERNQVLKELSVLGVVDSSGLFGRAEPFFETRPKSVDSPFGSPAAAPPTPVQAFRTEVRLYPDQARGEAALKSGAVSQLLVVPATYLGRGNLRRYARSSSLLSEADSRSIGGWLSRGLVRGGVDSLVAARAARPAENEQLYNLNRAGAFELKDDRRQALDLMLPLVFALLLGMCITMGGQYLLQGVAEEKESRILESLLCSVSPEELMAGKLLGLGGPGLMLVAIWTLMGVALGGPALALMRMSVSPTLLAIAVVYFLLGYLFYGSLMTGIGAITNNMREAQQFAFGFTFTNFIPLILFSAIVSRPNSTLAVVMSMIPPTAAPTMMMRLIASGSAVPAWQIGLSIALLAGAACLAVIAAARVFRIGLLLYGKTPNLPEIMRWVRG